MSATWAILRQEWRILRRDPLSLAIHYFVLPVALTFFVSDALGAAAAPGVAGVRGYELALPGFTVMFAFYAMAAVCYAFQREAWYGTWQRILAAPVRPAALVAGKLLLGLSLTLVQLGVMFAVGVLGFRLNLGPSPLALGAVLACIACVATSFGLVLATFTQDPWRVGAVTNVLVIALAGLGGAIVPLPLMPEWARALAPLTPHYWALRAVQDLMFRAGGLADIAPELAVLSGYTLLPLWLGLRRITREQLGSLEGVVPASQIEAPRSRCTV